MSSSNVQDRPDLLYDKNDPILLDSAQCFDTTYSRHELPLRPQSSRFRVLPARFNSSSETKKSTEIYTDHLFDWLRDSRVAISIAALDGGSKIYLWVEADASTWKTPIDITQALPQKVQRLDVYLSFKDLEQEDDVKSKFLQLQSFTVLQDLRLCLTQEPVDHFQNKVHEPSEDELFLRSRPLLRVVKLFHLAWRFQLSDQWNQKLRAETVLMIESGNGRMAITGPNAYDCLRLWYNFRKGYGVTTYSWPTDGTSKSGLVKAVEKGVVIASTKSPSLGSITVARESNGAIKRTDDLEETDSKKSANAKIDAAAGHETESRLIEEAHIVDDGETEPDWELVD